MGATVSGFIGPWIIGWIFGTATGFKGNGLKAAMGNGVSTGTTWVCLLTDVKRRIRFLQKIRLFSYRLQMWPCTAIGCMFAAVWSDSSRIRPTDSFVCLFVSDIICVHRCAHTRTRTRTRTHTRTHTCAHVHAHTHACTHAHMHTHAYMHRCLHTHVCTRTNRRVQLAQHSVG